MLSLQQENQNISPDLSQEDQENKDVGSSAYHETLNDASSGSEFEDIMGGRLKTRRTKKNKYTLKKTKLKKQKRSKKKRKLKKKVTRKK